MIWDDDAVIVSPMDFELELMPYAAASDEQVRQFFMAVGGGLAVEVEEILKRPQDPNLTNKSDTALLRASQHGHGKVVQLLLEASADIHAYPSPPLPTPVEAAAEKGHADIVRILLEAGANTEHSRCTRGEYGRTPLGLACCEGHTSVVKLLLDAGADRRCTASWADEPAIATAARSGHVEVVRLLLEAGDSPDTCIDGPYLWTPIGLAAREGHAQVVRLLLEARADMDRRCIESTAHGFGQKLTPIGIASRGGNPEITHLLLRAGANPDPNLECLPLHESDDDDDPFSDSEDCGDTETGQSSGSETI